MTSSRFAAVMLLGMVPGVALRTAEEESGEAAGSPAKDTQAEVPPRAKRKVRPPPDALPPADQAPLEEKTLEEKPLSEAPPSSEAASKSPRHFGEVDSRWYLSFPPYEINEPGDGLDPYRQNVLKGDYPILGDDIFLALTFTDRALIEGRELPTPTGITQGSGFDFFGKNNQLLLQNFAILTLDVFKGQQAFKPVDWRFRASGVYNNTYLEVEERGVVHADVSRGRTRYSDYLSLQEALVEVHLFDLSDRYDFISLEAGILPFRSDFRGFIFDDTNLGVRLFGNYDDNKWQYNVALFHLLEKDTNSELNTFEERDQSVVVVNLFRQDFPVSGYTPSLSFHYSFDDDTTHFDRNGFLARPAPVGRAAPHEVESYYVGLTGEGHLGKFNVTHAYFHAFGHDDENPFAGREVDINAYFGAAEVSYDIDWLRLRGFGMYASGDDDARDGVAHGFDAIVDAPNFAGGQFSFFNRQAIRLLGVNLVQRNSFLPDLSTSKFEGQANFVNPGLILLGGAVDIEITPQWRAQVGSSYLRFVDPEPLEAYLQVEEVDGEIGTEIFAGTQYRPLLTNNIILTAGFAPFFPGEGFKKIYQSSEVLFSVFGDVTFTW